MDRCCTGKMIGADPCAIKGKDVWGSGFIDQGYKQSDDTR